MHRRAVLAALGALALGGARGADSAELPAIDDLRALGAEAAHAGIPVIVMFSTPGCSYCREARQNYLVPRLLDQQRRSRPEYLLREIDITSRRLIGAIDGRSVTEAQFAELHGVRLAPVLLAFDPQWRPLGERLVGLDRSGFYESYLSDLIAGARSLSAVR